MTTRLGAQGPHEATPVFSDILNHWASRCILALARRGIINGYLDGTFRPDGILTRAEFAALMMRVFAQLPDRQRVVSFGDVPASFWGSAAIVWVSRRGLFSGFDDGTFRPQQPISRLQALIVLEAGLGASHPLDPPPQPGVLEQQFSDVADIPAWSRGAIAAAVGRQLLERLPHPRPLLPHQAITRGEVAALLCRALAIPADELTQDYPGVIVAHQRQAVRQRFLEQEAGFNAETLAFLDRGIGRSPYQQAVVQYPSRLQTGSQPSGTVPLPLTNVTSYPRRGTLPPIDPHGLDFLSPDIVSGCLCLGTVSTPDPQARWLGRIALNNRELWSATKFVPLLNLVDRANAALPDVSVEGCRLRAVGGSTSYPIDRIAAGIVSYDNRIATSNALAATLKHLETPAQLERWMQQLTGNTWLTFRGRYGEAPFMSRPELWDPQTRKVLLASPGQVHHGDNLVSTYDLTRLMTMAAWHDSLPAAAALPAAQHHSLQLIIRALGLDTARYVDVALDTLGLVDRVIAPVILSKSGFGYSSLRNRTELSYSALIRFSLPRQGAPDFTATHQRYNLGLTLIAAKATGDRNEEARYVDALMAAEVTEILRRLITDAL